MIIINRYIATGILMYVLYGWL